MAGDDANRDATYWPALRLVAHQLVRSGCVFGTSYPGSPVVELAEELQRLDQQGLIQFRYATNEKIAFEMAAGVALAGQAAVCVMKNVGFNVALDAAIGIAYTGVRGPLVLVVGDDPSCDSSSSEQDSRQLARLLSVPCLEPAEVAELPAAVELAVRLSAEVGSLVLLRLTNEQCYGAATLTFEPAAQSPESRPPLPPIQDRSLVLVPSGARAARPRALERLEQARQLAARPGYTWEHGAADESAIGFVVANALFPIFRRAAERLQVDPPVLRTLQPYPLNTERVVEFAARYRELVVVEALDPILEEQVLGVVMRAGLPTRVRGSELFPRYFQLDEEGLAATLAELLGRHYRPPLSMLADGVLARGPTFCAGCPHTAFFFGFSEVLKTISPRPFIGSDVGCYTLGARSGIDVGDVMLCMGAGLGLATGTALRGVPSVALIGDSTFLHSGLPSLLNAIEQGVDLVLCILDNGGSAMTGGQWSTRDWQGDESRLFRIALGLGASDVAVVDPFASEQLQSTLERMLRTPGVSVLISRSPCALTIPKRPQRPQISLARCTACGDCVTRIHCPAISLIGSGQPVIDHDLCVGCGFCAQVCPETAITARPLALGAAT
jgi:indolepyruvate ferredoxin oxidoreductase, alpha subunit